MKDADKKALNLNRKKLSLKTMYFNRYLFVRYLSAGFFFINLYWLIALFLVQGKMIFIPALLILSILPAVFEQAKLYSTPQNITPRTRGYYWLQLIVNVGLLLATFTPLFQVLFPFMKQGINGRTFIVAVLLIGCFLCLWIQHRLRDISSNNDKHYQCIKQYEKSLYL
ncbi:TPA: hypothetical protein ACGBG5_001208 [Enterococcus faecalis]|uniref:hypothetical protein n=1 Tax=Enterococcus faecalis TaxID=1351 RepID=UPI0036D58834